MHTHHPDRSTLLFAVLELLFGVILLFRPVGFTTGILVVSGAVACGGGVMRLIAYFRAPALIAQQEQSLFHGLILLSAGLLFILGSGWIVTLLPALTILYGAAILISGFYKIQQTADMLRLKENGWTWVAANAALSLVFAVIIILNPFTSTALLWTFTAISLLMEAVLDIIFIILCIRNARQA